MTQDHPGYANLANLKMLETLYEEWLKNPESVDISWKNFFEGMQFASDLPKALPQRQESADLRVYYLIEAYRTYGHLLAQCNVIATDPPPFPEELKLENFGLSEKDLDQKFPTMGFIDQEKAPLREMIDALKQTYCDAIGIEYMHVGSEELKKWIQKKIEPFFPVGLQNEDEIALLEQLNHAEGFETFLHRKYVGQKRFSLEGAEAFIPLLHAILNQGGEAGVSDAVIGMAHRGRLNVLANIMGKSYAYIFEEFEDYYTPDLSESSGDVKYHMGFAGTYQSKSGAEIQVVLAANPSHLESVNPVVEGNVRAIQEQRKEQRSGVLPILVHGDAAIAGQGVVYETLALKDLNGYGTEGTIHIVINNQIGFTTLPKDSCSTRYCTDVAKAFDAPILHVNGEDPAKCVAAARLATELRQQFKCDVFIDLMGYRKYGHNEGDEPVFTQPLEYQLIRSKKSVREIYRDRLIERGILSQEEGEKIEKGFQGDLQKVLETVKSKQTSSEKLSLPPKGRHLEELFKKVETKVEQQTLITLGKKLSEIPPNFNVHPKVQRLLKEREEMLKQDPSSPSIDWGMGEMLAYATLVTQKVHVRLSGQDVRRGTFSHRHSIYVDQVNANHYFPLSHLSDNQAPCDVFNSPLSEEAVMGFEFGYSSLYPNSLVIWEAQYGDFANGAQVIVDQYLSSSEMKWGQSVNLTLLLPHGYEGTGPEHSSARIERYLQLCGDENMIVANCSLPAQFFHLLRSQAMRSLKKPLIVFTPKGLLRAPLCRSPLKAFTEGEFEHILDDPTPPQKPKRILFCSGKFFYELFQEREKRKTEDVILRIEQIYPFHEEKLKTLLQKYQGIEKCIWVQEEHQNMGCWNFLRPHLERALEGKIPLSYIGRKVAASPAAGSHALHKLEHEAILDQLYSQGSKT